LNTDNRLLTGINVTNEYMRAAETFNFTIDELKKISRNGFEASFLPEERKNAIVKKFDES
jgi:adenosine deaminase